MFKLSIIAVLLLSACATPQGRAYLKHEEGNHAVYRIYGDSVEGVERSRHLMAGYCENFHMVKAEDVAIAYHKYQLEVTYVCDR